MSDTTHKVRMVGINHVVLEVDNLDEALDFYGRIFELEFRNRFEHMAFLDMGDQFLALAESASQQPDEERHFGLVVDNMELARAHLASLDVEILPSPGLEFRDPWGNHIQIVEYANIQFSKTPGVLRGMGLENLPKSADAERELSDKGMAS